MDAAAADQLRELGFLPPPAMPDVARRELIRQTVVARIRGRRETARRAAAFRWWAPARRRS